MPWWAWTGLVLILAGCGWAAWRQQVRIRDLSAMLVMTGHALKSVAAQYADLQRGDDLVPRKTPVDVWQLVLQDAGGATTSVRRVRENHVPLRIVRGHWPHRSWSRLTRIEGLAAIYTPEVAG